jgi:signal transduction histidine kinase
MGDALKTGQALVKDKPVKIELVETSPVPQIHADALRLRQIMLNLVSNAVKFTEHGSVTISYGMHNDHEVFIKVQDTGMGISPDNLPLIFERFRQVDGSSTRRAGGTGLGLSITQQLVQLHGGDIYAESTLGTGSTFWFTLPTSETAPIVELATTNGANGKH